LHARWLGLESGTKIQNLRQKNKQNYALHARWSGLEPGRSANGGGGFERSRGFGFVGGRGSRSRSVGFVVVVELEAEGKVENAQLPHSLAVFADSLLSGELVVGDLRLVRCGVGGHGVGLRR